MSTKRPLTLAELDATIRELGFLGIGADGDGCGETWAWRQDRPMLPSEMAALLRQAESGTVSPDLIRDMTAQLRMQARAFVECAAALALNDASRITLLDAAGLGIAEVREILDVDLRATTLPQGAETLEAHAASRGELASLFRVAATHCERAADAADVFRLGKWGRAYEKLILATASSGGAA